MSGVGEQIVETRWSLGKHDRDGFDGQTQDLRWLSDPEGILIIWSLTQSYTQTQLARPYWLKSGWKLPVFLRENCDAFCVEE